MSVSSSYLAGLFTRFVSGIKGIAHVAPVVLALGCESEAAESKAPAPLVQAAVEAPKAESDEPKAIGDFAMTFYYVIGEDEVLAKLAKKQAANTNVAEGTELASITAPAAAEVHEEVTLYEGKSCDPIADVTKEFAAQLALQGTGKLKDGRLLNVWGPCSCDRSPCFKVTDTKWGTGGTGRALQPFRTVAVDRSVIKLGSLIYVPELEGRTMPGRAPYGGWVHDGCLVADDTGGGIKGRQLDLFVGRQSHVASLSHKGGSHAWARHMTVFDGSKICERKGRKIGRKAAAI